MKPTLQAIRHRPDPFAGDEVLAGLRAPRKHLPCKLLYDARGAELFEQICTLDEYYPYRAELALLERYLPAIAQAIGPAARVIEPGSGAGRKTRMLLAALDRPASYVPIDVSAEQLAVTARELAAAMPARSLRDDVVAMSCTAMNSGCRCSNCCCSARSGAQETNNSRSLTPV